jgi:integrase
MTAPNVFEVGGETLTAAQIARQYRIPALTFQARLRLGWTMDRALNEPVHTKFRRGGRPKTGSVRACPTLKKQTSGKAYVRWKAFGKTHERSFGVWGTDSAKALYRRFAAEWASGKYDRVGNENANGLRICHLLESWLAHVEKDYRKDGEQTSEVAQCRSAGRFLTNLYGDLPATEFQPAHLRAVRDLMVSKRLARVTCNAYCRRIVRMFSWGVGQSLVPPAVHLALKQVEHLKAGRTAAPDKERRKPATDEQIAATLAQLSPRPDRCDKLAAMVQIQRLAGMRPGELCKMRPGEVDRNGEVWRYTVTRPKNAHRGKAQVYYLGPKAVALLAPYLDAAEDGKTVFRTSVCAYRNAIRDACRRAGVPIWTPHQLRHALATAVADRFRSLDHAAAAIGDTAAVAAAVYVHLDPKEKAKIEVAKAMG